MGSRHRMPGKQRGLTIGPRARHRIALAATTCHVGSASLLCAASLAALMVSAADSECPADGASVTGPAQPQGTQTVSQEGTLIAVSANSVTARSANGYTQTYVVTPNTAVIGSDGSHLRTPAMQFAVDQHVDIVGTLEGGKALATAVAGRDLGHGGGPPMDYAG
ncbi:hypothetical protein [Mycobacterium parmense]|uniref:Uncharacterized protein n=1 Tax=Mycobacterium parmense TaxID=185642 RepID=A0A7I7Z0A8_9MYCO|nr:hypothetical protein [Mycobacterium parmense]MCV7349898.1 hypothetical protein [Mycobacterium parmense]ORW59197.1 hypothetical protein AWC20_09545 [Mycobacterium parmense]BBZ46573.1 hypothetical protein MPRM_38540 [Mycobacterium parmense]